MTNTLVIIGATSYVGSSVLPTLLSEGYRIVALTRRSDTAKILLGNLLPSIELMSFEHALGGSIGPARAVLNFSYVTDPRPSSFYASNRGLIQLVDRVSVVTDADLLLHISSLAVFGYTFSSVPQPTRAPWTLGSPYVESKIYAEHKLERLLAKRNYALVLLRLGNVVGAGAPAWVASLSQRIMEGKPVGYQHSIGYSNTTYIANIASYILHVLKQPKTSCLAFGPYHHLAEFCMHSWAEILAKLADAIGQRYRVVTRTEPQSSRRGVIPSVRQLYGGAVGGYLRAILAIAPARDALGRLIDQVKLRGCCPSITGPPLRVDEAVVLEVMSNPVPFRLHTMPDWVPPVSFSEACTVIAKWATDAGFRLRLN